jgi:transketolase
MPREIDPKLVEKAVHTIQMLAVDGVEKAKSGHPGAPMGQASIAFETFMRHLRFDPADPWWPGRDRFVLSSGHASMLLYAMLHLCGYDLPLEELERFRQWGSKTPGHPECRHAPGVETTTGPLGQGIATAVGMAAGLKMLAARLGADGSGLCGARVFGIAGDGDMMEGISGEAASLAGHLRLDNLVFFYDDNHISIDGPTSLSFSEDVGKRFEAYGWYVQRIDGHDHAAIRAALDAAVAEPVRPSLIMARTHIAQGSPNKHDTAGAHGSPLGPEETRLTKQAIGWPLEPTFLVPDDVRALFAARAAEGAAERKAWLARRAAFEQKGGATVELYRQLTTRAVPADLLAQLVAAAPQKAAATRVQAGLVEQSVAALVPSLVGGSADLTPSNNTTIKDGGTIGPDAWSGRNWHFGVREHAMAAMAAGLALTDAFVPFVSTFLVFSDYMRPAIRVAALSRLQVVYVFTHDSLHLGEDGPTHQPVEHCWALRLIPNLDLVRPADALECAAAWAHALERRDGPTALALTRHSVPNLPRPDGFTPELMLRGAYVLSEPAGGKLDAVLVATGSEVSVAYEACKLLAAEGKRIRLVSAPCWSAFERQDAAYRAEVLPPGVPRASFELGVTGPWRGVVGERGLCIGHDGFGMSAPSEVIAEKLGFVPPAVAARIRSWLALQG